MIKLLHNVTAKTNKDGDQKESLVQHTDNALDAWSSIRDKYQKVLIIDDEFWYRSFLSVLFHDFGKISDNFQQNLPKGKKNIGRIRHEFLSGLILLINEFEYYQNKSLSLAAVFSHHKRLDLDLFSEDKKERIVVSKELVREFIEFAKHRIKVHFDKEFSIKQEIIQSFVVATGKDLFQLYNSTFYEKLSDTITKSQGYRRRKEYIYYKAILNASDWSASGNKELGIGLAYNEKIFETLVKAKLFKEGKLDLNKEFEWREFQKDSLKQKSDVIAIAPTGSGKTEASLLWASKKKGNEKIIYLLPTRVTSNAIYERLKQYFGDNTAVVHSSAFFYQKEINDKFGKGDYLADKTFFKNINVCTIDQALTQGFNLGYWELKTFHMLNAWVIIDEIHLYAPYTLGLIISTIKYLRKEFNTRFFIMTATMPQKLKDLLAETLEITINKDGNNNQIIEDKQYLDKARNVFYVKNKVISELYEEIKEILKGNKVLIVVNTVDEAINVYNDLKNYADNAICYHSRFIQKHRIEKEKEILNKEKVAKSLLLVATQVVEVSLDINFDILYSENAPIDAIVQRAGRVNRKRSSKKGKVIVFKEQEVTHKIYDIPNILDKTFGELSKLNDSERELTERQLTELVDTVYEDLDITTHPMFKREYENGRNKYNSFLEKLDYIKDNRNGEETLTREGLNTRNVIPLYFKKEEGLEDKSIMEKSKHEVSISEAKYKEFRKKIKPDTKHVWYEYIDKNYCYETGLDLTKEEVPHTLSF